MLVSRTVSKYVCHLRHPVRGTPCWRPQKMNLGEWESVPGPGAAAGQRSAPPCEHTPTAEGAVPRRSLVTPVPPTHGTLASQSQLDVLPRVSMRHLECPVREWTHGSSPPVTGNSVGGWAVRAGLGSQIPLSVPGAWLVPTIITLI